MKSGSSDIRTETLLKHLKLVKEGDILEFGVWEGFSLSEIVAFLRANNMKNRVFGFDSFQGIPEASACWDKGTFASSYDNTVNELTKKLGNVDDITLVPGIYEQSLSIKTANKLKLGKSALIHIDSDTYESACCVLEFCKPLLQEGTIIIFDDWVENWGSQHQKRSIEEEWVNEINAWFEFCQKNQNLKVEDLGIVESQQTFLVTGV